MRKASRVILRVSARAIPVFASSYGIVVITLRLGRTVIGRFRESVRFSDLEAVIARSGGKCFYASRRAAKKRSHKAATVFPRPCGRYVRRLGQCFRPLSRIGTVFGGGGGVRKVGITGVRFPSRPCGRYVNVLSLNARRAAAQPVTRPPSDPDRDSAPKHLRAEKIEKSTRSAISS